MTKLVAYIIIIGLYIAAVSTLSVVLVMGLGLDPLWSAPFYGISSSFFSGLYGFFTAKDGD